MQIFCFCKCVQLPPVTATAGASGRAAASAASSLAALAAASLVVVPAQPSSPCIAGWDRWATIRRNTALGLVLLSDHCSAAERLLQPNQWIGGGHAILFFCFTQGPVR